MQATIKIFLRNKIDLNNQKPVVLRITKDRKSKIITLGLKSDDKQWDFELNRYNKKSKNYLKKNRALIKLEDKALSLLDDFIIADKEFSLKQFEKCFRGVDEKSITVYSFLRKIINDFDVNEKYSSSEPYKNLESALFKFANKTLEFKEIDFSFLKKFELYLRDQKNTDGGIAFKMRHLRSLMNNAINSGVIDFSFYPFRKYKISKLKSRSNKTALNKEEIRKFEKINLSEQFHLINSHNLFMFSFYCRGINFIDMMELKWSDIFDGKIHYYRRKTNQKFIIEISSKLEELLDFYQRNYSRKGYVFPILLKEGLSPLQKRDRKQKTLKKFNKDLKALTKLADINKVVTSYVARHTYATFMYNAGESVEMISASMGHSSVLVTMSYLKDFEDSVLDEANRKLLEEPMVQYS